MSCVFIFFSIKYIIEKLFFLNFENKKGFYSLELFFCLMVWYNPFSWGKQTQDVHKNAPGRFSVRDRFLLIRSEVLKQNKQIIFKLINEWKVIAPLYVLVQKKTKANFMVARVDTIALMQDAEFKLYSNRLTAYADEVDVLQSKLHTYSEEVESLQSHKDRQIQDAATWNFKQASRVLSDVLKIKAIVTQREAFMEKVKRKNPKAHYYPREQERRAA